MPSFEFADCPTRLDLAAASGSLEQTGSLSCTLRNTSARRQTARVRIEPLGSARPDWFALGGAPPTSPVEIEQDIDAGGTLTVTVALKVPPKATPGVQTFRLRAISESTPDTDFTEGPAIAFDVAAAAAAAAKPRIPWWALAAAVLLVLIVGGAVAYIVWPKGLDPSLVNGSRFADAKAIAAANGFPDIKSQPGPAKGNDPDAQIVVGVGKDAEGATVLLIDPGIPVPSLRTMQSVDAARKLMELNILPVQSRTVVHRSDMADGAVADTIPSLPRAVALGGTVTLVINDKPDVGRPPRTINPCFLASCADLERVQTFQQHLQENLRIQQNR